MEKQIDEMAKDLCRTDTCEIKKIEKPCYHRCKAHIYDTRAIDKGYRKAADVAREIFAEIEKIVIVGEYISADDFYKDHPLIAELKKKYTKEE